MAALSANHMLVVSPLWSGGRCTSGRRPAPSRLTPETAS
jgi:hypothetical protein